MLTKPLGVGCHASAVKKGVLDDAGYADLIRTTTTSNRGAMEAARPHDPSACTDVTGFGLLGHALEMAQGAGLTAELWVDALPVLPQARALLAKGVVPGATRRVLDHADPHTTWAPSVDDLDLSVRAQNCLRAASIKTIGDLVRRDESEMLKFRNFGRKSLQELIQVLEERNLRFGMDISRYNED